MFEKEETDDGAIQSQGRELIKARNTAADELKVGEERKEGDITKINDETFDSLIRHQREVSTISMNSTT